MQDLLAKRVNFDLADERGRTPFLVYYEHKNFNLANRLLDAGASVNHMDNQGLFALKYALIRRQDDEIKRLITKGAQINQIDK
jgi:ankyrin repeat protein